MSRSRRHHLLLARRGVQLGVLALLWAAAHRGIGVLSGDLGASTFLGTLPLSDPFAVLQVLATGHAPAATALLGAGLVLAFYALVGGRTFCSWVCPVNPIADLAGWLKRRFELRGQFLVSRETRRWVLVAALGVSAVTGVAAFELVSPIGMVQRGLIFGPLAEAALVVLALLVLDLWVVKDGWCGSLCPLGAFYGGLGRFALVRMRFEEDRCDHCGDCHRVCPERQVLGLKELARVGFVHSGDCTNCTRCQGVCPSDALHLGLAMPGDPSRRRRVTWN